MGKWGRGEGGGWRVETTALKLTAELKNIFCFSKRISKKAVTHFEDEAVIPQNYTTDRLTRTHTHGGWWKV